MQRAPISRTASGPRRPCGWSEALLAGQETRARDGSQRRCAPPHPGCLMPGGRRTLQRVLSSFLLLMRAGPPAAWRRTPLPQSYIDASMASPLARRGVRASSAYRARRWSSLTVARTRCGPLIVISPWRTACAPAGRRRSFPPKAKCWAPSQCTFVSPAARVRKTCMSSNRSLPCGGFHQAELPMGQPRASAR